MTQKHKIKIVYTTQQGTECESFLEAQIVDVIEQTDGLYIEAYKRPKLVKALMDSFSMKRKYEEEKEKKEENETL